MGQDKGSPVGHSVPLFCHTKLYIVSLPINIVGEDMAHPSLYCAVHMYLCTLFLLVPFLICTYVHSSGSGNPVYKFMYIHQATVCNCRLGTQRSPFYKPWLVFLLFDSTSQEQDCVQFPLGPMVPCTYCIFTHDLPVASFYPSNPKKSQSRCLLSLCIVLLVLAYFYAF